MPRLPPFERAIYSTIAYRDVFDFAVTATEIHRYLHGISCTPGDVDQILAESVLNERYIQTNGTYFALTGREGLFAIRKARATTSEQQWPLARRFAQFLANLPNVRMVALTGSLATGNLSDDGDIDFLLLTDQGTMWRTRALCRSLALIDRRLGRGLFCPNMFLSSAALTMARRSQYDAQELCQMVPMFGSTAYEEVRQANAWTNDYLPNAGGAPWIEPSCEPLWRAGKNVAEWLLDSPIGRGLERFEARRKLHRFNETNRLKGAWTRSTREMHSLWDDMRIRIEKAWKDRLALLEGPE